MLRTNEDKLVDILVVGEPSQPKPSGQYLVTPTGAALLLPGTGGICTNVRVGDSVFGYAADHLEPAVSMRNMDDNCNSGLNLLACIGNEAEVLDGPAEGARGVVTGKHGGIEHVFVDFPSDVLMKLRYGNRIQVRGRGLGLELADFPSIRVCNIAPSFFHALKLSMKGGRLRVPVAKLIPACLMGSGLGNNVPHRGDYDIQMFDSTMVEEHGLGDLRLGDLVALVDADNTFGRIYLRGAVTVGIISHGACHTAGHGPGVTCLLSSAEGLIDPVIDSKANIADILGLRDKPKHSAKKK